MTSFLDTKIPKELLGDDCYVHCSMVNGGIVQLRTNIEMNINTRIQKRSSNVLHKNVVGEHECMNVNWKELLINNTLKKTI